MDLNDADVRSLSDDELRSVLIANGYQVGPIVDSTREFYRKVLVKRINVQPDPEDGSEVEEEEAEDELIQSPIETPVSSMPAYNRSADTTDFRRRHVASTPTTPRPRTVSEKRSHQGSSTTSWCSLIVLAILSMVCVFIALVFFYVEPNPSAYEDVHVL